MDMQRLRHFKMEGNGILVVHTIGNKDHILWKAKRRGFKVRGDRIFVGMYEVMVVTFHEVRGARIKGLHASWWFAEDRIVDEWDLDYLTHELDWTLRS
jgi:hypothetical protein